MTLLEYVVSHIVNLIKIDSLMTLTLTAVFSILALNGTISAEVFMGVYTVIVGFYFGTKNGKNKAETEIKEKDTSTVKEETSTIPAETSTSTVDTSTKPTNTPTVQKEDEYHEE